MQASTGDFRKRRPSVPRSRVHTQWIVCSRSSDWPPATSRPRTGGPVDYLGDGRNLAVKRDGFRRPLWPCLDHPRTNPGLTRDCDACRAHGARPISTHNPGKRRRAPECRRTWASPEAVAASPPAPTTGLGAERSLRRRRTRHIMCEVLSWPRPTCSTTTARQPGSSRQRPDASRSERGAGGARVASSRGIDCVGLMNTAGAPVTGVYHQRAEGMKWVGDSR